MRVLLHGKGLRWFESSISAKGWGNLHRLSYWLGFIWKTRERGAKTLKTGTNQILKADVRFFIILYSCFWTDDWKMPCFINWILMCLNKLLWYPEDCGLRLVGEVRVVLNALFKNSASHILRSERSNLVTINNAGTLKWVRSVSGRSCISALVYLVYVKHILLWLMLFLCIKRYLEFFILREVILRQRPKSL